MLDTLNAAFLLWCSQCLCFFASKDRNGNMHASRTYRGEQPLERPWYTHYMTQENLQASNVKSSKGIDEVFINPSSGTTEPPPDAVKPMDHDRLRLLCV